MTLLEQSHLLHRPQWQPPQPTQNDFILARCLPAGHPYDVFPVAAREVLICRERELAEATRVALHLAENPVLQDTED